MDGRAQTCGEKCACGKKRGDVYAYLSARVLGRLTRKEHLALADLEQVTAPLHKGVDLRKDAGRIKVPFGRRVRGDRLARQLSGRAVHKIMRRVAMCISQKKVTQAFRALKLSLE
jgi:hypothetical protein